ncbi:MAG: hypothetical protein A2365_02980 [Candidatus Nealsonbacteria bacterium RIFOXYB1_FULL_40_15]|uniref:Uncharacterized protein n=2 Tax=Candidatus Nealsoniibacteriota TaxID=1817911 RepID=A0A1G2EUJ3_9BACT|nr:MAG: hypothetical protein A2365_02980 [Candidatus Nealsonbacteria bacterium RIFOXYB1_FULL_40_15]OGZ29192.1 MAG: hypothetical protein A2427_02835 [Candidatus Nealsonbacteria bacterium RIFOXYC1_FULL_40_7]OGZ29873.1 MAG: hypothetical protein A2562_02015 [Candidatus Nealsonbacteria bacterium RIFOXYD1_FULL_39_11]
MGKSAIIILFVLAVILFLIFLYKREPEKIENSEVSDSEILDFSLEKAKVIVNETFKDALDFAKECKESAGRTWCSGTAKKCSARVEIAALARDYGEWAEYWNLKFNQKQKKEKIEVILKQGNTFYQIDAGRKMSSLYREGYDFTVSMTWDQGCDPELSVEEITKTLINNINKYF